MLLNAQNVVCFIEIEKYLNKNKIDASDIFYQSYNIHGDGGNLVCKICDPNSFKK